MKRASLLSILALVACAAISPAVAAGSHHKLKVPSSCAFLATTAPIADSELRSCLIHMLMMDAQGVRVVHGIDGSSGGNGKDGAKGDKGDKGDPGKDGVDGATGPQGPKGDTGDTGPQGPEGPQGPQGEPGPAGEDGDNGGDEPTGDDN